MMRIADAIADSLDSPASNDAGRLGEFLANAFGPATLAVIHYGSRAQRSAVQSDSAHDFFVIVDDYRSAFRRLRATMRTRFFGGTASLLAKWLPPNVVALSVPLETGVHPVKCAVLDRAHFRTTTSGTARDHFVQGRLFQFVQIVWTRDAAARGLTVDTLIATRRRTFDWGRPSLPERFTVDQYVRAVLETSFAWEIRPEAHERVETLLAAQLPLLRTAYTALLRELAAMGALVADKDDQFRLGEHVDPASARRVRRYFARSKRRSTLRWAKHIVLYDDWLDYVVRKVERRTGRRVVLTAWERRWPLVFLWPRAIRFLLDRPQRRGA